MFCAFLVITLSAFSTAAEITTHVAVAERDHSFESLLSLAPTVESDWIVQQETRLRQELATTISLPGYLFFFNFGSDATCDDGSFKSAMIRRLNNCYYGVKYTAYVTVKGNYGLKVQYYDDSSCKSPADPTPQQFFFPKNTCVGGVKFFTAAQMPAQPPSFISGVLFSSYRTKAACDASSDGISGCESFDVYKDNVCFPGRGGDVKYVSCDGTTTTALVYGSIGGQCAGTSNTRTYNNDPECRQADIYGGKIERYIIHSCLLGG